MVLCRVCRQPNPEPKENAVWAAALHATDVLQPSMLCVGCLKPPEGQPGVAYVNRWSRRLLRLRRRGRALRRRLYALLDKAKVKYEPKTVAIAQYVPHEKCGQLLWWVKSGRTTAAVCLKCRWVGPPDGGKT